MFLLRINQFLMGLWNTWMGFGGSHEWVTMDLSWQYVSTHGFHGPIHVIYYMWSFRLDQTTFNKDMNCELFKYLVNGCFLVAYLEHFCLCPRLLTHIVFSVSVILCNIMTNGVTDALWILTWMISMHMLNTYSYVESVRTQIMNSYC